MKQIPPIKAVMTTFPHFVDVQDPVSLARELMQEHEIRHLPVMQDGKPFGLLRRRDLERAPVAGATAADLRVGDVCADAYVVELSEPLDYVLMHMAERHADSALVVKEDKLVGIFTATDACRSYGELLRTLFPRGNGEDVA